MALIVETGSGSATAESFASVADADAYLAARGQTSWAALTTGDKESNLRKATDYMQQMYRGAWAGMRATSTQALDWPRINVPLKDLPGGSGSHPSYVASNIVPAEVKTACIMLALRAISGNLAPDLGSQKASVKVGPIETTFVQGTRQTTKFQAVDSLLQPYFTGSGSMMKVVRA